MPLQATSGAASYDGFGGGVAAVPQYIEDVFSTYLYTGNGSTQTITNGIDLAGKGGLVWTKKRSAIDNHMLADTARGASNILQADRTDAQFNGGSAFIPSFTSSGYTTGTYPSENGATYASWTFRKQPKFFDVVTYTGDGNSGRTIAHSLGSTPGFMIIKSTTLNNNWIIYHRSLGYQNWMILNGTSGALADSTQWVADPTSTVFTVGSGSLNNASGQSYVAYLFAHNAGGFGLTGTDNVISCGVATMPAGGGPVTVNLGWEPQWVLMKDINHTGGCQWFIQDNMRGWPAESTSAPDYKYLQAHLSSAEGTSNTNQGITSTGFSINSGFNYADGNTNIIYIAIRRGPMKVPTDATKVFKPGRGTDATSTFITTGFTSDLSIQRWMGGADNNLFSDRLRGFSPANATASPYLISNNTNAEVSATATNFGYTNTGFQVGSNSGGNWWALNFQRAPSFFDEVCYTGTGSNFTQAHNLGVPPELVIIKNRTTAGSGWSVPNQITSSGYQVGGLNTSGSFGSRTYPGAEFTAQPTASSLFFGTAGSVNSSGATFVAYLFATCAGVSKVGSYTGTGTTQQINCGFTAGSRFVLIKRTDSTGDWYVWDSARGIVAGNDPYLLLNSTAAEVTSTDYIDTYSAGFEISSTAPAAINASGGTFIFLAIA